MREQEIQGFLASRCVTCHGLQLHRLLLQSLDEHLELPRELEDRVMNYYTYQYKNHQGFDHFQMLQTLPAGLRTDILLKLTRTMIEQVPFFKGEAEGRERVRCRILVLVSASSCAAWQGRAGRGGGHR